MYVWFIATATDFAVEMGFTKEENWELPRVMHLINIGSTAAASQTLTRYTSQLNSASQLSTWLLQLSANLLLDISHITAANLWAKLSHLSAKLNMNYSCLQNSYQLPAQLLSAVTKTLIKLWLPVLRWQIIIAEFCFKGKWCNKAKLKYWKSACISLLIQKQHFCVSISITNMHL